MGLQLLGCKSKEPVAELPPTELIGIEEMSNNSDAAKAADAEGEGHDEGHGGDMKGVRELRVRYVPSRRATCYSQLSRSMSSA